MELGREIRRLVGFGTPPTIHVDREADDRATDFLLGDQITKSADVALSAAAFDDSGRKRELPRFVGNRKSNPLVAQVDAEYTHARECSDSPTDAFGVVSEGWGGRIEMPIMAR